MKTRKWYAFVAFTILFSLLFWKEKLALNFVLFSWSALGFLHFAYQAQWTDNRKFLLAAHVLTSFGLIYAHSGFASVMNVLTFVLAVGSTHQSQSRSPILALFSALDAFLYLPVHQVDYEDGRLGKGIAKWIHTLYKYRLVFVLFMVFLILFFIANMAFQGLFIDFMSQIGNFLERLFKGWDIERLLFTFLGSMVALWFLFAGANRKYIQWELRQKDFLQRIRKTYQSRVDFSPVQLRISKKVFHISFVSLNLLLLLVNALDVAYVWFKSDFSCRECLSRDVHFGVDILILSILLASALVLYTFRGNLNFIRENKGLRHAAVVWIAQNIFLLVSVVVRNSYYVGMHGLTYKRIGVYIFLTLVVIGLVTLLLKVIQVRTLYYIARINAFAWVLVLSVLCIINWDRVIFSYNTTQLALENVDYHYLLELSNEIQPDLYRLVTRTDFELSQKEMISYRHEYSVVYDKESLQRKSWSRIELFQLKDKYSWLSFNFRDQRIRTSLLPKNDF